MLYKPVYGIQPTYQWVSDQKLPYSVPSPLLDVSSTRTELGLNYLPLCSQRLGWSLNQG